MNELKETFAKLGETFMRCFVNEGYWKWLVQGFKNSLIITFFAILIGFVLTWVVYEISLLLQKKKISRIDMVEALKENNRNE